MTDTPAPKRMEISSIPMWPPHWEEDCKHWRGRRLIGKYCHYCQDWDGLPIDETCPEWPCACAAELEALANAETKDG